MVSFAYKLVQFNCIYSHTQEKHLAAKGKCEFRIFLYSSDSGRWVESRSRVSTRTEVFNTRVRCWDRFYDGSGKMYWHCEKFLVYYDTEGDAAGDMAMPVLIGLQVYHQELELREGLLMCSRWSCRTHLSRFGRSPATPPTPTRGVGVPVNRDRSYKHIPAAATKYREIKENINEGLKF